MAAEPGSPGDDLGGDSEGGAGAAAAEYTEQGSRPQQGTNPAGAAPGAFALLAALGDVEGGLLAGYFDAISDGGGSGGSSAPLAQLTTLRQRLLAGGGPSPPGADTIDALLWQAGSNGVLSAAEAFCRGTGHLNADQVAAITTALRGCAAAAAGESCWDCEGFLDLSDMQLIHGPPGTGKTDTLGNLSILQAACGAATLVYAPSNAAIATLLARVVQLLGRSVVVHGCWDFSRSLLAWLCGHRNAPSWWPACRYLPSIRRSLAPQTRDEPCTPLGCQQQRCRRSRRRRCGAALHARRCARHQRARRAAGA